MERRSFLKASAALGCAATVTGCKTSSDDANVNPPEPPVSAVTTGWQACFVNCGSNCPVKFTVVDGVVTQLETDNVDIDSYENRQIRACPRGRSLRQRIYADNRIKYPMKRVGPRGSGEYIQISWQQAIAEIYENLSEIYSDPEAGPESILFPVSSGTSGMKTSGTHIWKRLFHLLGGYLNIHGSYSTHQIDTATLYTYGVGSVILNGLESSTQEIRNSDLVVCFGYNPQETFMSGGGVAYEWSEALSQTQAEVIMIDPRYTESAGGKENTWLPILPGTDAALVEALIYELIQLNAVDDTFLKDYVVGWTEDTLPDSAKGQQLSYKDYILGNSSDNTVKDAQYAETITGISQQQIKDLASKLANASAPFIQMGWGLQRQANGENSARAIYTLIAVLGKFGLPGTSSGVGAKNHTHAFVTPGIPSLKNPVTKSIPAFTWTDAIANDLSKEPMTALTHDVIDSSAADPEQVKLDKNLRAIIVAGSNMPGSQHADINRTQQLLADPNSSVKFVLVSEIYMTPSAKMADIILPEVTQFETNDIVCDGWHSGDLANILITQKAIEPMYEAKTTYDICTMIAERFGKGEQFTEGRTKEEWLKHLWATPMNALGLPDYDTAKTQGIFKHYNGSTPPGLQAFRQDPIANKLNTPSGKIEIYSESLVNKTKNWILPEGEEISAIPKFANHWEGATEDNTDYPFQVASYHTKGRVHSSFHSHSMLRHAVQDCIWLNPIDARELQLSNKQLAKIASPRGEIVLPVRITSRVRPKVIALSQGAWRTATQVNEVDYGGSINVLTSTRPSLIAKGCTSATLRVKLTAA